MRVRFVELLSGQHTLRLLGRNTLVARFQVEDGFAHVQAGAVHAFSDLRFLPWNDGSLREKALMSLCSHVEEAEWADPKARTLDLAGRFAFGLAQDARPWRVRGFTHLQTCDLKILKHVLGVGSRDPEVSVAWWAQVLGQHIEPGEYLDALDAAGCREWRQLQQDRDPGVDAPIRLYRSLSPAALAECLRVLAPLREGFQRTVLGAIRSTASGPGTRHVHSREAGEEVMHFLDDRGLMVVARGPAEGLSLVSAYDAHSEGERRLGERTLSRWFHQLHLGRRALRADAQPALFHTPENWRSLPRTHGNSSP